MFSCDWLKWTLVYINCFLDCIFRMICKMNVMWLDKCIKDLVFDFLLWFSFLFLFHCIISKQRYSEVIMTYSDKDVVTQSSCYKYWLISKERYDYQSKLYLWSISHLNQQNVLNCLVILSFLTHRLFLSYMTLNFEHVTMHVILVLVIMTILVKSFSRY